MKSNLGKKVHKKFLLLIFAIATCLTLLNGQGQQKHSIKGQIKDQQNMQAMAYATVALRRISDSTLITGTTSNPDGEFILASVSDGKYSLIISAIGFNRTTKNIDVTADFDAGTIFLQEKSLALGEIVIVGERLKAKAEPDKTTYFVNKKMYDASNNGVDLLSYIPGVQIDIMKNISLEGSQHIIIMVDGKERERNYLSQLNAGDIDKVEVINTPDSRYDAGVTGVINIILKKDNETGMNGHINLDVPTSRSEIYAFPDCSFNYNFNKINLYTSYNGEFSYFDQNCSSYRNFSNSRGATEITSDQILKQKDWSHRFHYGFDFFLNERNQINFYAFYNPWSNELNGHVGMTATGDEYGDQNWSALKRDADINSSSFYSLYYKHLFNKLGRELAFDLNYYNFRAENKTTYIAQDSMPGNYAATRVNTVKPKQNSVSFKIDYTSPLTEKLKFDAGIKVRSQLLSDRNSDEFKYDENIFAFYGTMTYSFSKITLSTGVRAEKSSSGLTGSFRKNIFALLPDAIISFKLNQKQNIKISYNHTVYRPNIYELNPYTSFDDPYSTESGNPDLKPEFQQNLSIDYSRTIGDNYISVQLNYLERTNAINHYTFVNASGIIETRVANLGYIQGYAFQTEGALKLHKAVAINPFLKLTDIFATGNSLAKQYDIKDRHRMQFQSGLSAIVTFKYDIIASFQFQYTSPLINFQDMSFSDALYFISLEKTFNQKFKIGITSAIPFSKSFTYTGSEIKGANFYSHSEGNLRLTAVPVWLKFTYQFNSGKAGHKINRDKEDIDNMPKKGF